MKPSVPFIENALFRAIARESVVTYTADIPITEVAPGEVLFREGEEGDACYLIEAGSIRITVEGGGGDSETLAILGPGEFFGELALIDNAPRSATAGAVERTRLARLDRTSFAALRNAEPLAVLSTLSEISVSRIRNANAKLVREMATAGRMRDIGRELGTIAHNLRAPLATIQSAADMLIEAVPARQDEGVLKFAGIIRRTAERALGEADALLRQLRGEAGAEISDTTAEELANAAAQQVSGLLRPNIDFGVTLVCDGPMHVVAGELTAAVVNLLRNSIEALPPEGGKVSLAVEHTGQEVQFIVTDTGRGIAPEHRGQLFEKDFTYGKAQGTGLGLAHVSRFARKAGGRVELLSSEQDRGTSFLLVVPARLLLTSNRSE